MFHPVGSKATVCAFTYMPNIILTGHESGKVALFDVASGTETANNERAHMDTVTDLQLSLDRTYFVTSSKDKMARVSFSLFVFHSLGQFTHTCAPFKLHDTKTLRVLKTFPTETPLNSAALAPNKPYVRTICLGILSIFKSINIGSPRWRTRGNAGHNDVFAAREI